MRSETYTLTPDAISHINSIALTGRGGYIQGYTDERGSLIALLIPCDEKELDRLVRHIKGEY